MSDKPTANDESINCLCCQKKMSNMQELRNGVQPSGGLAFHTSGHFGSTLFDPMDGSSIHIAICDPCVEKAIGRGDVVHFIGRADRDGMIAAKDSLG